jgi:hypothetical protein
MIAQDQLAGTVRRKGSRSNPRPGGRQDPPLLELKGARGHALLGNTVTVNKQTGAETSFPVSTLTLYDAGGNVRLQLPR